MSHLSTCLLEGTQYSQTATENTAFMKCCLNGLVERNALRKFLGDLYFIYSALETALQHHVSHPIVGSIYFPELNRVENLARDLKFYYGDEWPDQISLSKATCIYCNRITEIAQTDPILLIAHAYTRYMGDLSGGQSLKNIIRSAFQLSSDQGTDFYEFVCCPTPEARAEFKGRYRQTLNALPLDTTTIDRIVEEANLAFRLNQAVVQELEADLKVSIGERLFQMLTYPDRQGSTERFLSLRSRHGAGF